MPERPTVSVIIPTRNRCHYLQEALDSVHRQTHDRWEAIVIDDASEDGTWRWLQELADGRIRSLRLDLNSGSTVTRNAGLRMARGDYCLFLDDDDRLPPDALADHLRAIEGHSGAIATLGAVGRIDADGAPAPGLLRPSAATRAHDGIWRDVLFWWVYLVGASLFRRTALEAVGGFDESIVFYGDDVDLWLRLGHLGPVVLLPRTVLEYRSHDQTRPDDYLEMLAGMRSRYAETCAAERCREARRIVAAHDALADLRLRAGEPGGLGRIATLLARLMRCPRLIASPLSGRQIAGAVRRELAIRGWLRLNR